MEITDDKLVELKNKWIKEGIDHSKPSPDTLTMINNLEKRMTLQIHEVKEAVEKRMDKFEVKLDGLVTSFACLDDKFVKKEDYSAEMGIVNATLEKLKAFRWQILAGGAVALWLAEKVSDKFFK